MGGDEVIGVKNVGIVRAAGSETRKQEGPAFLCQRSCVSGDVSRRKISKNPTPPPPTPSRQSRQRLGGPIASYSFVRNTMLFPIIVWALACIAATGSVPHSTCTFESAPGSCDGAADDTAQLQEAFSSCTSSGTPVVVAAGANCTSRPLQIPSNAVLVVDGVLQAADRSDWPSNSDGVPPFLLSAHTRNVTVRGQGVINGRGEQWWPRIHVIDWSRPRLIVFDNASDVVMEGVTLRNSAYWTCLLGGTRFSVRDVRIDGPDFQVAPETDGIDVAATDVHIDGVDIRNGDDSICIKSPSANVLVENSIVRQGNGLVVGTAASGLPGYDQDLASVRNVTFRNCTALDTTFGCHIKFKAPQYGLVQDVTFQDIRITQTAAAAKRRTDHGDWAGYAIGIHTNDQGAVQRMMPDGADLPGSRVTVRDVSFVRIHSDGLYAGQFMCSSGNLTCSNITLQHVHLNVSLGGCDFSNVKGSAIDTSPQSCASVPS